MTTKAQQIAEHIEDFNQLPDEAYVSRSTVCALFGISERTVDARVKAGLIPPPRRHMQNSHPKWTAGQLRRALAQLEGSDA